MSTTIQVVQQQHSEDDSKIVVDEKKVKANIINANNNSKWWRNALNAAIKGGASGSIAMVLQVILLMWLRTTVNYQYKHGVDARTAFWKLYQEGGILRFYRGATLALLTGPIARFGDTASNEGVKELIGNSKKIPVWAMTLTASMVAAFWRIAITPLDTFKTSLQVGGESSVLYNKIYDHGILVLWDGALGNSLATLVGHYPWFMVNNFLEAKLPKPKEPPKDASDIQKKRHHRLVLLRRAFIGFCCSVSSDCVSNGIRVIKTYQQTASVPITYKQAFAELLEANGPSFIVRGLKLKIVSNGLSGILFALLWKMILELLNDKKSKNHNKTKTQ